MGIAGAIVRETAFSRVKQYYTVVSDGLCLEALVGLVRLLDAPAVVLCSAGAASPLRHELLLAGGVEQRLFVVEEKEVPSKGNDEENSAGECSESEQLRSKPAEDLPQPCDVEVPPEAAGARLVVTYGGPLREAASLSKVIWSVRRPGGDITVIDLVSDRRALLLETQADVDVLQDALGEDRRHPGQELRLPGSQPLPAGVALLPSGDEGEGATPTLQGIKLPHVAKFRLRSIGLGFVLRLRQRFGLRVTEVMYEALRKLFEPPAEESSGLEDDWVEV